MDNVNAKKIILHAVKTTEPRWREFTEHWKDINEIFIRRGYEQQGFACSKLTEGLKARGIFTISKLGSILGKYKVAGKYDRLLAGSLVAPFYDGLRNGLGGKRGDYSKRPSVSSLIRNLGVRGGHSGNSFSICFRHAPI